jgi:hypothetical protein
MKDFFTMGAIVLRAPTHAPEIGCIGVARKTPVL